MLRAIDNADVFDRSDGIHPFLLVDGHGSRFELPFLRYVNDAEGTGRKWNACVGVPYGTSYWQVGDSSEQNGCFKMELTKYKRDLIVSQAWAHSFARIVQNKSAIADRGWNPLNYNCLLHPEIVATRYRGGGGLGGGGCNDCSNDQECSDEDNDSREDVMIPAEGLDLVEQLNLSEGVCGSLINTLLEKRDRDDARNGINHEEIRLKRIETSKQIVIDKKKRYTAGLHVSCQRYMVGPAVLDDLEEREQMQAAVISGRQEKKLKEFRTLKTKVDALKALNKSPVPTTRTALLERLHATIGREDPREPAIPTLYQRTPPPPAAAAAATMVVQDEFAD